VDGMEGFILKTDEASLAQKRYSTGSGLNLTAKEKFLLEKEQKKSKVQKMMKDTKIESPPPFSRNLAQGSPQHSNHNSLKHNFKHSEPKNNDAQMVNK
jgi:hypothetical protein